MKIAQKLGLLVGSLLVAMTALVAGLSFQTVHVTNGYNDLLSHQVAQGNQARDMQTALGNELLTFKDLLIQTDPAAVAADLKAITTQDSKVQALSKQLIGSTDNTRLKASLVQFQTTYANVRVIYTSAYQQLVAKQLNSTQANDQVAGQDVFAKDLINSAVAQAQSSLDQSVADQKASVDRNLKIIIGSSILLVLLVGGLVTLAIRGIVGPVRSLTEAALDAANNRLPKVVAQIASLPAEAETPTLPKFKVTTKDELAELAGALTTLQDSAVGLALDQRRDEQANAETLVNLGRRNQSLLTRMLSYVTELERDERDADTLDKLFRLDHLTTRIRRNAESLLVLAGAKQTRTWSMPIAIDDVLRAALSEIEEYTRVTVHHTDPAKVHGGVAADLTHMLAELLENATRFSPRDRQVLVVGRLTPSGYQFDVIDSGLGMTEEELATANERIAQAGQRRADTKVLGHHVVGRIAARRGIFVRLLPSVQIGITAQVLVPVALLSDAGVAEPQDVDAGAAAPAPAPAPAPVQSPAPVPVSETMPVQAVPATPAPAPVEVAAFPAPAPAPAPAAPYEPYQPVQPALPAPRPESVPVPAAEEMPGRRVRGAQLEAFAEAEPQVDQPRPDAAAARSQMSSLQSGVAAARNEFSPQPIPYTPIKVAEESPAVPTRRVRGAQLAELGPDVSPEGELPVRDPAAIGRQLSGLQAATAKARFESIQNAANDDTFGSNA